MGERKKNIKKRKKRVYRFTKAKILLAIKDSGGIVSNISEKLKCDWHTANKYINMYEETKLAIVAESESLLDNAEMALHNLISQGDAMMIRYYLSTKGKKRGYGEERKIDHTSNGKDINTSIQVEVIDRREQIDQNSND